MKDDNKEKQEILEHIENENKAEESGDHDEEEDQSEHPP